MTDTSVCVYHSFCEKVSMVYGEIFCFMSNVSFKQEKRLVKRVKLIIPHYILTNFNGPDWQSVDVTNFLQPAISQRFVSNICDIDELRWMMS